MSSRRRQRPKKEGSRIRRRPRNSGFRGKSRKLKQKRGKKSEEGHQESKFRKI
jgi:hypothetical protein